MRTCRLAEGEEHILTFHGRRMPATARATVRQFSHLWMDGQPQVSEMKVHQRELASTLRPGGAAVELGDRHPIALELDRLLVSRRALMYEYAPRIEAILFGPEHLTPALLVSTLNGIEQGRQLATRT